MDADWVSNEHGGVERPYQVLGVLLLLLLAYVLWEVGGVLYRHSRLVSELEDLVNYDIENEHPPEVDFVYESIFALAATLGLDVDESNIRIEMDDGRLIAEYDYRAPVRLFGQSLDWHFHGRVMTEERGHLAS
jgi:hypothetical protein